MIFSGLYDHMVVYTNFRIPVMIIIIFTFKEETSGDPDQLASEKDLHCFQTGYIRVQHAKG